ncbi:MAG: hypothetical protein QOH69_3199 [Actinomycetota bacterium]|jgi:hypothetical protein|nr:hypothetical protein [Actinomycetota bacterium]
MTKRLAAFCAAFLSFVIFLVVALWGATFGIDGNTSRPLLPGTTAPIDIQISNPHFYPIVVGDLKVRIVSITPARKGETCRLSNFTLHQAPRFSVRLDGHSTVTMSSISPRTTGWPSVHLTGNQAELDDGCQGATINLAYSAAGTWWTK